MSDLPESLNRARAQAFSRPAWEDVQGQRPPRPLPRQMRPPAQRANDPRLAQSERDRALRQFDRSNAANVDTYQRQAFDQRNQAAEAASMAAESTGLPAIRRAGSDLTRWGAYTAGTEQGNDDLASGALNLGAGSLGVLGMAGMVPRAPMRGALRPPVTAPEVAPPRITRPPTEIAPNGMPIAPPRPFRNSLRGGSSDLMDAAGMMAPPRTARPPAQAPDAGGGRGGNAYLEQLRAEGFNVDVPLYHGTDRDFADFDQSRVGENYGDRSYGISFTPDPEEAWRYAGRRGGGSVIRPVYVRYRNPLVFDAPNARAANETIDAAARRGDLAKAIAEAEAAGRPYDAIVGMGPNDEVFQVNILNPSDVAPRFGQALTGYDRALLRQREMQPPSINSAPEGNIPQRRLGQPDAPDAGGGRGGQDLSDFDTDQVWTRAVKGGVDPFEVQPAPGNTMGPGLYFGSDDIVGRAARRIGDDAAVHGAYIRNGKTASYQQWRQAYERAEKGPFGARSAAETERRAVADLERQGYIGVYRRHNHDGSAEINVFRRENVVGVPQESPAPAAPDVGNAGGGNVIEGRFTQPSERERLDFINKIQGALIDAPKRQARVAQSYHDRGLLPLPVGTRMRAPDGAGGASPNWQIESYYINPSEPREYGYNLRQGDQTRRVMVSYARGINTNRPDLISGWQAMLGPDGAEPMRALFDARRSTAQELAIAENAKRRAEMPPLHEAQQAEWDLLLGNVDAPNAPARSNAGPNK